jgi:hypothetical protein
MSGDDRRSDVEFVDRARVVLDAGSLAPDLAERLAAARRRAVASVDVPIPRVPSAWVPVGALATTLLAVGLTVAIDNRGTPPVDDDVQIATVEDMDLLMDLEFVAWLATDNLDAG